ncbi:hypothetical protein ACP70R_048580 [Stipagrostis hirtigluma subsp. patula]
MFAASHSAKDAAAPPLVLPSPSHRGHRFTSPPSSPDLPIRGRREARGKQEARKRPPAKKRCGWWSSEDEDAAVGDVANEDKDAALRSVEAAIGRLDAAVAAVRGGVEDCAKAQFRCGSSSSGRRAPPRVDVVKSLKSGITPQDPYTVRRKVGNVSGSMFKSKGKISATRSTTESASWPAAAGPPPPSAKISAGTFKSKPPAPPSTSGPPPPWPSVFPPKPAELWDLAGEKGATGSESISAKKQEEVKQCQHNSHMWTWDMDSIKAHGRAAGSF